MTRSLWKYAAAGCLALLAGCGDDPTGRGRNSEIMALRRALDRWNAQGADDYRMTVRRQGGMIAGAAIVTVRDGVPVLVQGIAPFEGMPAVYFEAFDTVDELFQRLIDAFNSRADRIDALYHPQLGLPVDAYIDPERNVVDEEYGFAVASFEILQ